LLNLLACIKHWFRGNSIKQYNKTGYFIRTDPPARANSPQHAQTPILAIPYVFVPKTCAGNWRAGTAINNPKSLGLNKPALYLQACPQCLF
jgi:hypothetical protein